MSKSSLQTENASLKATLAERDAQIATLTAAAAAAAEAKHKCAKKERAAADPSKPRMLSPYIVFCAPGDVPAGAEPLRLLLSDEAKAGYKSS